MRKFKRLRFPSLIGGRGSREEKALTVILIELIMIILKI
jgi:hypothetical protein